MDYWGFSPYSPGLSSFSLSEERDVVNDLESSEANSGYIPCLKTTVASDKISLKNSQVIPESSASPDQGQSLPAPTITISFSSVPRKDAKVDRASAMTS